jgi:hypothetical protein
MDDVKFMLILLGANLLIGPPMNWSVYSRLVSDESDGENRRIITLAIASSLVMTSFLLTLWMIWTFGLDVAIPTGFSEEGVAGQLVLAVVIIGSIGVPLLGVPFLGAVVERWVLVRKWDRMVNRDDFKSLFGWNVLMVLIAVPAACSIAFR